MIKNKGLYLVWILFYILLFVFLLYSSFNYLDTDFGWHLKVGQDINIERSVPVYDKYDYSILGQKWVDHEWLSNLLIYLNYESIGYIGLSIIFSFIVIFVLLGQNLLTRIFLKDSSDINDPLKLNILIIISQLWGIFAMSPHLGVRVQELALLFITILLFLFLSYSKNSKTKLLYLTPLIFYLWANMHASFLIGIFIYALWVFSKIVEKILAKYKLFDFLNFNYSIDCNSIKKICLFFILSLSTTFFTPYGYRMYVFLAEYGNTYYMTRIDEWLPPYSLPIQYYQLAYSAFFILVLSINFIIYYHYKKNLFKTSKSDFVRLDLFFLLASLVLFISALKSKRNFPIFFIISLPLSIQISYDLFKFKIRQKITISPLITKVAGIYLVFGVIFASLILGLKTNFTNLPFTNNKYCEFFPCEAIKYLKYKPEYRDSRLFNDYGWGGYLIWAWPEKKLFIDGRLPIMKVNGHTFLEEYFDFFDKNKVENKLNQYQIDLVLLSEPQKIKLNWYEKYILLYDEKKLNDGKNYLKDYLTNSKNWSLIYHDNVSSLYAKDH